MTHDQHLSLVAGAYSLGFATYNEQADRANAVQDDPFWDLQLHGDEACALADLGGIARVLNDQDVDLSTVALEEAEMAWLMAFRRGWQEAQLAYA